MSFRRFDQRTAYGFESVARIISEDFKKRYLVEVGDQYIPVATGEIAYFYYEQGSSWVMTNDGRKYIADQSLDQIENSSNPLDFFRINRQIILSLKSIGEIHTYFNSRLIIKLSPQWTEEVIVSRDRVTAFKRWMDL